MRELLAIDILRGYLQQKLLQVELLPLYGTGDQNNQISAVPRVNGQWTTNLHHQPVGHMLNHGHTRLFCGATWVRSQ